MNDTVHDEFTKFSVPRSRSHGVAVQALIDGKTVSHIDR